MFLFNNDLEFGEAFGTVQKFGRIPDIDSGDTNEDVWDGEGEYGGFIAANTAMSVSSSSALDTEVGTGARTVKVFGIVENADGTWQYKSESQNLDGQTAVSLTNQYIRVFRAYVTGSGSTNENQGIIYVGYGTVTAGVPANVMAQINATSGQTLMAIFSTADLTEDGGAINESQVLRWYASVGAAQNAFSTVAIQTNENGKGWRTRRTGEIAEGGDLDQEWTFGMGISAKTDMRIRVLTNGVNNSRISAGFDLRFT